MAQQSTPSLPMTTLRSVLPLALGIAFAALLYCFFSPTINPMYETLKLTPFYAKLAMDIGIAIILAVSLNIVNGFTGQFSLGHAAFMSVGGYTAAAITYYTSMRLWGSAMAQQTVQGYALFVGALLAGGLVAAAMGYVVGLPSLRLKGDYLAIVTLGFGEIVRVVITQSNDVLYSAKKIKEAGVLKMGTSLGGALGFSGLPFYSNMFTIWTCTVVTVLVAYRLKQSTQGLAYLSIRENEIAAEAMGVPITRFKVQAFVISAFFAGVAGGLYAHLTGVTLNAADLGFMKSLEAVIMVVLGGMGSITGAILSGSVIAVMPEALRDFKEYRMIAYALVLIIVMILRPKGLFGIHEIWDLKIFKKLLGRFRKTEATT